MGERSRPGRRTRRRVWQAGGLAGLVLLLSAFGCGAGGTGGDAGNGGNGGTGGTVTVPKFNATRAFGDLVAQTEFGPRAPGTAGHEACRQWLAVRLAELTDDVTEQPFTFTTPGGTTFSLANLLAVFPGDGRPLDQALMLCAHWDTRPVADRDPDPAKRDQPILGANDGGSGVAVLLEVGRALTAQAPARPVILALFDLEDSGLTSLTTGEPYSGFSIGARWFSEHLGRWRPKEAILVDMVGDGHLSLPQEPNSLAAHRSLVESVWATANALGFSQFETRIGPTLTDDHLPLIAQGVPAIDIIDFDYPGPNDHRFWHTTADVPANCDPNSLRIVGQTLLQVIFGD